MRIEYIISVTLCVCLISPPVIPVIVEPDSNTVITVNQSTVAEFDCSAVGIPAPTISWFRVYDNGTLVNLTSDVDSRVMLGEPEQDDQYLLEGQGIVSQVNRTLVLMNSADSDSGTYRCVATNAASQDGNIQDFELVVQGMYHNN